MKDTVHVLRVKLYYDPELQAQHLDGNFSTSEDDHCEEHTPTSVKNNYIGLQTCSRSKVTS